MGSNKLYFLTLIRVVLVCLNALLIGYLVNFKGYYLTAGFLGVLLLAQSWELLHFFSHLQRKLTLLFSSIRNRDFSLQFRSRSGNSEQDLFHAEINDLLHAYRKVKIEKEQQFQFLQHIIDFLFTGIISFTSDGKLGLYNRQAQEILHTPSLAKWSFLVEKVPEFGSTVEQMRLGEQRLLETEVNNQEVKLSMYKDQMKIGKEVHTVVSFQNISGAVERKELEAYQKLIRILTHEIMNSVTPMISISDTLLHLVGDEKNEETREDLQSGLKTIHERSQGIMHFVEDYRSLITLPTPNKEFIHVKGLLEDAMGLFRGETQKARITTVVNCPENLKISVDAGQIKQVLINLIKNSIEALEESDEGKIELVATNEEGHILIRVEDNGPGIPQEKLNRIFIPFFSTKEKGSGVGLSLAKSIVNLHDGSLRIQSTPGKTSFTLALPTKK